MYSDLDLQMQSLLKELKMRQETQKMEEEEAERQRQLKEEKERKEREESAVRIQKCVRMFLAMRTYQRLALMPFILYTYILPPSPYFYITFTPSLTNLLFTFEVWLHWMPLPFLHFLFLQIPRIERFEAAEGKDTNSWRTRWGLIQTQPLFCTCVIKHMHLPLTVSSLRKDHATLVQRVTDLKDSIGQSIAKTKVHMVLLQNLSTPPSPTYIHYSFLSSIFHFSL